MIKRAPKKEAPTGPTMLITTKGVRLMIHLTRTGDGRDYVHIQSADKTVNIVLTSKQVQLRDERPVPQKVRDKLR